MSGSQQTGTAETVQRADPWGPSQGPLLEGFERARGFLDAPTQYYPGSTVVPFAPQTEAGLGRAETRAMEGGPIIDEAGNYISDVIGGEYLNANPYMDEAISTAQRPTAERFADTVIPSIQAGFSSAGRLGSGLQAYQQQRAGDIAGREMGDIATRMSFAGYEGERGRQQQAAGMAPDIEAAGYMPSRELERIGAVREGQAGQEMQDAINRYMFAQTSPRDELSRYMATIGQGGGDTTTTSQPIYSNQLAERIGMGGAAVNIADIIAGWT